MRLLVVEDNSRLSVLLADLLTGGGFAVDAVMTAEDAEAALDIVEYDAMLLDLALPDGDGFHVLQALRRKGRSTPVLVITARGDVVDRVRTLNAGADDYLVKPFSMEELLARTRALLRRPPESIATVLVAGNVALDPTQLAATVDGKPLDLPRREFSVLHALLLKRGRVLRREQLERSIYAFDDEVTPNAIEAAVSRLRRHLQAAGATITITSMRGIGYIVAGCETC
ncbi:MAG TPA: response regulator transcription factor [Acetobacteraceae bacterium]|nr:response regulator transcription factor [Acetobacteraceae bacterium]